MIVVTGASGGLGSELCKLFVAEGKKVVGLSRSSGVPGIEHIQTDLLDENSVASAVKQILGKQEPLETVLNCAGVFSQQEPEELTAGEIDRVFGTNIRSSMLVVSGLMGRIKNDGTDIVNIASTVGLKAYAGQAAYGASKWAVRGFSQNLQVELQSYPSRVISFCPGGFKSKLFEKATDTDSTTNEGGWMRAEDIAKFIKQILELPKNMEVTEVIINRKPLKK